MQEPETSAEPPPARAIIAESPAMREVLNRVRLAARADSTVLLLGEPGSGKRTVARRIHDGSRRRLRPFDVFLSRAVSPREIEAELFGTGQDHVGDGQSQRPGRLVLAGGGTLFLDDVGELPGTAQARLLRVLETRQVQPVGDHTEREIDVRVIAATARDLPEMVRRHRFREDLFYRLSVVTIRVPPLRQRREDLPLLVNCLLAEMCAAVDRPVPELEPGLLQSLARGRWPGNARQLRELLGEMLRAVPGGHWRNSDLPSRFRDGAPAVSTMRAPARAERP